MFDLQELKIRTSFIGEISTEEERKQNFVGIKRNSHNNDLELCLPKGFDDFPKGNYEAIKKIFFRTYKTYRKFFEEMKYQADNKSFDGFSEFEGGYTLVGKDENVATYSKLTVFDSILDSYNELQILTLQNKLSKSNDINYSRIEKYLHRGIYLEDDTVFIDEMEIPKKIIDLDSPTLVQMFCYIYSEIKTALEETIESHRTKSLAQEFKERFLNYNSSLFNQETFSETLTILKDTLDNIDKYTAYKDEDYWHFFEAIYTFLYGENEFDDSEAGTIWGLDDFSLIWEELCYNYALSEEYTESKILFADRFGKFTYSNGFKNPFIIQINGKSPRYIRPDLVVVDKEPKDWGLFDFLNEIFDIESVEIPNTEFINLRLTPKFENHTFNDLWVIYLKYVAKNPKVIKEPLSDYFRNVAHIHKEEFIRELLLRFNSFTVENLINRKPNIFNFIIIDYKYVAEPLFKSHKLTQAREHDIKKQLVYEMALQSGYETTNSTSQFWIPGYFGENAEDLWVEVDELNFKLESNGIAVLQFNFEYLQEIYLQQ